jgi:hypothetical protein
MKRFEVIITIIAAGSLWGLFEIFPLPTGILCAIGLFFLVFARYMVNIPGTSTLIGAIVCVFKAYSAHFMMCQTAGVMSLAVSFDLLALVLWDTQLNRYVKTSLVAGLSGLIALPVFIIWVTTITPVSFWVDGGWDRIVTYAAATTIPAILLGIIAANGARLLARQILKGESREIQAIPLRYMFPAVLIAWSVASAIKFL